MGRSRTMSALSKVSSSSGSVFFPLVLDRRLSLGMSGVRRYFAPLVSFQQSIHYRRLDPAAQLFFQSPAQWRHHHQLALLGFGLPIRQKNPLGLKIHERPPPSSPPPTRHLGLLFPSPEPRLEPSHRRPPNPKHFGRSFQCHLSQGGQKHRLSHA